MHELSVTQSALEAALLRAGTARITDVHLAIGTVSAIEPESIRLYWDEISKGTLAEGAVLHFQRVPTESVCMDCGHRFLIETEVPPCPACQGLHVSAVDDEYLGLAALDVEQQPREIARE